MCGLVRVDNVVEPVGMGSPSSDQGPAERRLQCLGDRKHGSPFEVPGCHWTRVEEDATRLRRGAYRVERHGDHQVSHKACSSQVRVCCERERPPGSVFLVAFL